MALTSPLTGCIAGAVVGQSFETDTPAPLPRLLGLHYLRGAAALCVLIHHATAGHLPLTGTAIRLFFVISGFLMLAISDTDPRPGAFLRDRIVRIVPNYWIATTVAAAWFAVRNPEAIQARGAWLLASYAFVPMRDPIGMNPTINPTVNPVLPQGWTLDYEMFFYLIIALMLFVPRRARLAAVTAIFVGLILAGQLWPGTPVAVGVWTDPIIANFLAGAWLWAAWRSRSPLILAGMAMVLGTCLPLLIPLQTLFGALLLALFAMVTVGGVLLLDREALVPRWRIPTLMGDASYSIYLWHYFPIWLVQEMARAVGMPWWFAWPVAIGAGLAAGLAAYRWIEAPLLTLLRHKAKARRDRSRVAA